MRGDRDGTAGFLMAGQRRGVFEVDEDRALEALRLAWGDAYDIGFESGRGTPTSRDAEDCTFTGDTPDALNVEDPRRLGARGHAVTGAGRPALRVVGGGAEDAVVRRQRFEEAHPEAVILPPCAGRWRAVVPAGLIPGDGTRTTLGAWDLGGLMNQLDAIYRLANGPASPSGPEAGRGG